MRLSTTLSTYIGRQFLIWFCAALGGMLAIIYLLDTVELLRRAANKPDASFELVVLMGFLKLPEIGQEVVPFVVLFGGMYTFWRLTRTQELVVARASGISVWQFMAPVLIAAGLVGALQVTVLNPIYSAMISRYEQMENRYLRGQTSTLDIARSGIWLRQVGDRQSYVVHAESVTPGSLVLNAVLILLQDPQGQITGRLDARTAELDGGNWLLRDVWFNEPGRAPHFLDSYALPTELTEERIQESFASPDTLSFWELPGFIATLEETGLSAVRHRLYWHTLLAKPFLFCAMVLLAGAFALRQVRKGGTMTLIGLGLGTALVFFVMKDVVLALGTSGTIPVLLSAWAPAGIGLMLGTAALLHLEDG